MNSIAQSLKIVESKGQVNDVSELFHASMSDDDRNALHYYCRWIIDIYQHNQATAMSAAPGFPEYRPLEGAMVPALLAAGEPERAGSHGTDRCLVEVPMPPLSSLLKIPAHDLLAIKRDVGAAYLGAVEEWQVAPSDEKEEAMKRCLAEYGDALVQRVMKVDMPGDGFIHAIVQRIGRGSALTLALTNIAAVTAAVKQPWIAPLVAVGNIGYAAYSWHRRRPRPVTVEIGEPSLQACCYGEPDVNISPWPASPGSAKEGGAPSADIQR